MFAPYLLGALRRRRRGVAALLLPALLAWMVTGSACVVMTPAAPVHADHAMHESHADRHAVHRATPHPDAPCAHCPTDGTAALAHSCAAADSTVAKVSAAPLPNPKPPPLAADWVPLPLAPAPPLIRLAAPQRGATTRDVPLNILHCVLLI